MLGDDAGLGDEVANEPNIDGGSDDSDLGHVSESSRSCQAMWLTVLVVLSCLTSVIHASF
jgi:hypothetical protein